MTVDGEQRKLFVREYLGVILGNPRVFDRVVGIVMVSDAAFHAACLHGWIIDSATTASA